MVVGATGSGKSMLAERLAVRLAGDYVELDALFWEPDWKEPAPDAFLARVDRATAGPAWVAAGNYGRVRDLLWARADTIVWLDYRFPLVFARLTGRTLRRAATREVLWSGNREYLWKHLKLWSDDSLYYSLFTTYRRYRRELPALFALPAHAHLDVVRLRAPREAERWMSRVARPARPLT